jgi:plastocyanin
MISTPARWPAVVTCMLVLLMLGANSCGGDHQVAGGGGKKKTKQINCDADVDVDVSNSGKGVKKKAVYVCPGDTFTWKVPSGHTFSVVFSPDSTPFTGSSYDQNNATATALSTYPELTVYKYSITVDTNKPVDPQVVAGGN